MDRRAARVMAMQALCQQEVLGDAFRAQLDEFLADVSEDEAARQYARALAVHAMDHLAVIDATIQKSAKHWDLSRMVGVERNILRAAVAEWRLHPSLSRKIVINEAVEIAKTYGAAESGGFVNGVLDAIRIAESPPPTDAPTSTET
jgi:N utilization substance protein B